MELYKKYRPKELKDFLRDKLVERGTEMGDPDFVDKIADETVVETGEQLVEFLTKVGHPALEMEPLF